MAILAKRKPTTDDLRRVALTALVNALEEANREKKDNKRGRTVVRALAAGAVIYTAGHVAVNNRHLIRQQLLAIRSDEDEGDYEPEADEEELSEEDYEEPAAEDADDDDGHTDEDQEQAQDEDGSDAAPQRKAPQRSSRSRSASARS